MIKYGCTDGTTALIEENACRSVNAPVRIIREEKLGLSNARNCAIRELHGAYLIFIDDDKTPDSQWLRSYERCILTYKPDAIEGKIDVFIEHGQPQDLLKNKLPGFLDRLDYGHERWLIDPSTQFYRGKFSARREVFDEISDFDSDQGRKGRVNAGGQDTDFYRRLVSNGYKVRWLPDAIIFHRILADRLHRKCFLSLHYNLCWIEGERKRGRLRQILPKCLFGQLLNADATTLGQWLRNGLFLMKRNEFYLFPGLH